MEVAGPLVEKSAFQVSRMDSQCGRDVPRVRRACVEGVGTEPGTCGLKNFVDTIQELQGVQAELDEATAELKAVKASQRRAEERADAAERDAQAAVAEVTVKLVAAETALEAERATVALDAGPSPDEFDRLVAARVQGMSRSCQAVESYSPISHAKGHSKMKLEICG
jgi:hypothetical protein